MTSSEAEQQGYERVSKNPKSTRYGRQNPICAEWNSEEQILQCRKAWEDVTNIALERHKLTEHVDCRSFKERGITEQPTIHEGAASKVLEKQGFVSDRRELNRQIKKDNELLRELKATVQTLTDKVKNSVQGIAERLEAIRSRLIMIQYQINFNTAQSDKLKTTNTIIDRLLKRYRSIVKDIKAKTSERKRLQSEKRSLSPLHIIRHNKLSGRISELTEDIEELKNQKNIVLEDMYCENDKQVSGIERRRRNNAAVIEQLEKRNSELAVQKKNDTAEFEEIRSGIAAEDADAVQKERLVFRDEAMNRTRRSLQEMYGHKYSYDEFRTAIKIISRELNEITTLKKSILKQLQKNQWEIHLPSRTKKKEHEL